MWIIENRVQMHPRRSFYYRLVLEPEMNSNLIWIRPPTWLGRPCLTPKVMAKEEDVLGHLLGVLHLLRACSMKASRALELVSAIDNNATLP
jgi:hypothetical protein